MNSSLVKRVILLLGMASPCMAATLRGVVMTEEGEAPARTQENLNVITGAKVVVYHELTPILVQRGVSDNKGRYHFDVEPGPYRVFIVKKGYRALMAQAMVLHGEEEVVLQHQLQPELNLTQKQPKRKLKDILRRSNREPHRDISGDALIDVALMPVPDDSLSGTFRAQSHQDLEGVVSRYSKVEINTQLNDQLAVHSSFTNQSRDTYEDGTLQIEAGILLDWGPAEIGLEAETIRLTEGDDQEGSERVVISSQYGDTVKASTAFSFKQSREQTTDHRQFSFHQDTAYELLNHSVRHDLHLTGWERDDISVAQHALVITDWRFRPAAKWGLRSDVDYYEAGDARATAARLWLTADHEQIDRFGIHSRIGVHREADRQGFIQHHRGSFEGNRFHLHGEFLEDHAFQPYATRDIYGAYLPLNLLPYASESFYQNQRRRASMKLVVDFGLGWNSNIQWRRKEDQSRLLLAHQEVAFKDQARRHMVEYAYSLESHRLGARIEVNHSKNESEMVTFDQTGVVYAQSLNPFRNRGMGLLLELSMRSQPNLPAWWLLETLPWDPEERNTWYEGHLSLQF